MNIPEEVSADINEDAKTRSRQVVFSHSKMSLEDPTTSEDPAEDEGTVPDPPVIESAEEDKNRKVRRSLEIGDSIEQVYNVSRIVGLDAVRESSL